MRRANPPRRPSPTARAQGNNLVVLENVRFHKEEEKNDPAFARQLADLADVYVNDAFGSSHRAHASTEGMAQARCREPAAGFLMESELKYLGGALESPERPFVAVLGGAKVSDKIEVIENFLGRVDALLIGGAMAYTFFSATGCPSAGRSSRTTSWTRREASWRRRPSGRSGWSCPSTMWWPRRSRPASPPRRSRLTTRPLAIAWASTSGRGTAERYASILASAKTVVWNGPMGVFETSPFDAGTTAVARAVAAVTGTTIIGGGDSVAAVAKAGVTDRITHISTGGGASLEFLGGAVLPGVAALSEK